MSAETVHWMTVNSETGEMRRLYADGAALIATGTRAPDWFWQKHPLIAEAHATPAGVDQEAVRIFLAQLEWPEAPETEQPDRPADMRLSGEWKTDRDFWAAHPAVEHAAVQQLLGFEPDGDCWVVELWLKG
ncbi:hypothetical protein [Caulobacter sp. X]|uniref:hypothetical protein n=1 Tax=Caulobacter sp. X TaxID=2048901 RepID=UPI000C15B84B|nr:hypothetical protein [Caulobacter sp. X]PIB95193.1 hypothetical protein CSW60_21800 [Caulobacter sp. X]